MVIAIIIIALAAWAYVKIRRSTKQLAPLGTITVCTGAVKTGKSTLAVYLAQKCYKKALRQWRLRSITGGAERPLLYSNIPLSVPYVPITTDILLRRTNIIPKSVVLLDEASLVADSQLIKDGEVNKQLLKFFKLFGHQSHGGSLILDTQSISDLHYAIKRCISNYLYIKRTRKWIPFLLEMDVIEQRYSDDGTIISAETKDDDDIIKHIIIPKRVWKTFDCYCYSAMTDHLPVATNEQTAETLKAIKIPSFRNWEEKNEKKN